MITRISISEAAKRLGGMENILLVTHTRPDGDTLGSAGALCSALQRAGKTAYLWPNSQITELYIDYVKGYLAPEDFQPESVVCVDLASPNMYPVGFGEKEYRVDLCIDHHESNSGYAPFTCLDSDAAAAGEVVYEIIREIHGGVTKEEADLLYVAISTDCGCFRYNNTRAKTLRIAADLMEAGADGGKINKALFETRSRARIALESMVLSSVRYARNGEVALVFITREMLQKSGAGEGDQDSIASIAGSIAGVKVGITVRERADGTCKVSVRSLPGYNASKICAVYGGGGHAAAAGCTLECGVEETAEKMLQAVQAVMG